MEENQINIKATTTEGLGEIGAGDAIGCPGHSAPRRENLSWEG